MNKKRSILIFILFILGLGKIFGCFCESETFETANFEIKDELFLGKVINIKRFPIELESNEESHTFYGTETTFEVLKKWKGDKRKEIIIYQPLNTCALHFTIRNSRWIISAQQKPFLFAELNGNFLQTDDCSFYAEEIHYEGFDDEFNAMIQKIDGKFPNQVKLNLVEKKNNFLWLIIIPLIGFLIYRLKAK